MKEEQTPAGTTQTELKHYCDLFKAKKNGVIPKRILVQGQTGIGKSTFVKKLLVDWVDVNNENGDEQAAILKNFELVVAINLKEVSKCQSLKDVIRLSKVFAKEDKYMTEGLADYITNNQEKVLLIFDGYDEYRSGLYSEIYEIFSGNSLRSCCVQQLAFQKLMNYKEVRTCTLKSLVSVKWTEKTLCRDSSASMKHQTWKCSCLTEIWRNWRKFLCYFCFSVFFGEGES